MIGVIAMSKENNLSGVNWFWMEIIAVSILIANSLRLHLEIKWMRARLQSRSFANLVLSAAGIACSVARSVDP